jgi:nucleotide-binding universal stress UspA family protein
VVVGVDDIERGRDAAALAKTLMSATGEVTLLYVDVLQSEPTPESSATLDAGRQRFGLERLRRVRDEAAIPAAKVARIQSPSVHRGLCAFAAGGDADLIVIGAGGRNPIAVSVLGDEARELLEDAPCPVAVAPAGYAARKARVAKVGVGYDATPEAEEALAPARQIATACGATVSVYEAVHAPIYARDVWDVEGQIDQDIEEAREQVTRLPDVEPYVGRTDDTVEGLRHFGETVDLHMLGSHHYRPPERFLHRSKAQRLAEDPSSPLLVLSSHGHTGAG